jgi:dCMP deaminase
MPARKRKQRKKASAHRDSRPSFDEIFSRMCLIVARRSTCHRRRYGAVVTRNNQLVSSGYNGAPKHMGHCIDIGCLREQHKVKSGTRLEFCRAVHAEMNALLQAGIDRARGGVLYTNSYPCKICARLIVQCEISRVVLSGTYSDFEGIDILRQAGVKVDFLKVEA